jgi:hypothetical protein
VSLVDLCLNGSSGPDGVAGVRLGEPLLDVHLEFVAPLCRPKTVLAPAFDLKVFFTVVGKPPAEVTAADVLGFITAQRTALGPRSRWPSSTTPMGCRRARSGAGQLLQRHDRSRPTSDGATRRTLPFPGSTAASMVSVFAIGGSLVPALRLRHETCEQAPRSGDAARPHRPSAARGDGQA